MKVIIIGGGWAGVSAALTAKKAGADVEIFERTDMLLGLGNVGGIMRNNGRFTAAEEIIAMGAGELIDITDRNSRHVNIDFPGHNHASLYDVNKIEVDVRNFLEERDIKVSFTARVVDIEKQSNHIKGIYLEDESFHEADVFVEATGSTGPMGNCLKYGNGCAMCVLRCPTFGPRISISAKAGAEDYHGEREDGLFGAFSGSCKLAKDSLSEEVVSELNEKGVVILKVPPEDVNMDKLKIKVCQQYDLPEFAQNIVLLDTGNAKLMSSFYPLAKLRKIKGLEHAKYIDPYAGGKGNSIRYLSMAPRDDTMKVKGIDNLFVGGEKAGLFVGHTEAMVTGAVAGTNAVRQAIGQELLILPRETASGDIIAYANEKIETTEGRRNRYTFAGAGYFKHMQEAGLYTTDVKEIEDRIEKTGLKDVFKRKFI
ncbi:FAD-dependent oxidoreductase [Clostridium sp. 19966]|uniref:FAD-dependent oxidoreductase n=1 Tax=Clostridium sp. 19966 TaxID=2768166 RepID=UPI0028E03CEB|nr:FAD-dependent oxidoreductase [Clostridium sp. 19966]MDT8716559.1 FAD-dependent oxidoreductase [Clostridium sp. 19966]